MPKNPRITLGSVGISSFGAGANFEISLWQWGIVLFAGIMLFVLQSLGIITPVSDLLQSLSLPIRTDLYSLSQRISASINALGSLEEVLQQNRELAQRNIELESQAAEADAIFQQNKRLLEQVGINYGAEYSKVGASIVALDPNVPGLVTINKGSEDGVIQGAGVVTAEIAVGEVVEVSTYTSKVRLLNNSATSLAVKLGGENVGLLNSRNATELLVTQVLQSRAVQVGDRIFTSGLNSGLPADLYLGRVQEVVSDPRSPTKELIIDYPLDLRSLVEVTILVRGKQ